MKDRKTLFYLAQKRRYLSKTVEKPVVNISGCWLKRDGRCQRCPSLLMLSTQMAAELVVASLGKKGQANVRCGWSRQILQSLLANDGGVEEEMDIYLLMNADGVVLTAMT